MANYIGGDFLEITCSHEDLGDLRLSPKAGESFSVDYGGITTADDEANITGNGQMIQSMVNGLWSVEGPVAVDFADHKDIEKLHALASSTKLGNWTFTHISGLVLRGKGKPVGKLPSDTTNATKTLKIAGGGKLEQIS